MIAFLDYRHASFELATYKKGGVLTLLEQAGVEMVIEAEKKGASLPVLPLYRGNRAEGEPKTLWV